MPWDFQGQRWRRELRKKIKKCKTINLDNSVRWVHHITLRDYDESDPIISKYGMYLLFAQDCFDILFF